jgi:hypothetical protein
MIITKGEFCQFSLNSRMAMIREFGTFVCDHYTVGKCIMLYEFNGYFVEIIYDRQSSRVEKAEPVINTGMLKYYRSGHEV